MSMNSKLTWLVASILGLCLLFCACSEVESGPNAWIDYPRDGAVISPGEPLKVISHAYAPSGLTEVVLIVNGIAYRHDLPAQPNATFSEIQQEWTPEGEGGYTLQITAYSLEDEPSTSESISVRVASLVTPIPIVTTPPGLPDLTIESVEAPVIGDKNGTPICNTRVVYSNIGTIAVPIAFNIQYQFNGVTQYDVVVAGGLAPGHTSEVIFDYAYEGEPYIGVLLDSAGSVLESNETNNAFAEVRPCGEGIPTVTPTSTSTVVIPIVTTEVPVVTTPPPPADTTPPTPPTPAVPANGLEIACKANQNLVWMPSTDPSGIARYELRLERRASVKAKWTAVDEWNKIKDKQLSVPVECGYYYRWSVRAVDGAGNSSAWSAWSTFSILLP